MMKKILMTMMAFTLTIAAQGQTEMVDTAQFVAVYDYELKTVDDESKPVTDRMQVVVQVGRTVTKSMPCSGYRLADGKDVADLKAANQEALMHMPTIWTGLPEGQTTVREFIFPHEFEGNEPTPDIRWTLTEDTLTVVGYPCRQGVATWRGVAWTAWYTEDIPSSAGPWRLRGLPGLIVRAESEAHTFVLAELRREASPIAAPEQGPDVQRMAYAKLLSHRSEVFGNRQYPTNPLYYIPDLSDCLGSNGMSVTVFSSEGLVFAGGHPLLTKAHAYQPLELIAQAVDGCPDQSQLVVVYDFVTNTTDKDGRAAKDSVRLAVVVGSHTAKCMEFNRTMMEDFGETGNRDYQLGEWDARKYNLPVIYVGWPEGMVSAFDKIVPNRYFYTEPLPDFHWQLADDTLTVGGYLCRKAVGRYAGRTWTAWYAEDVAVPYGPWKLRGLPGMILRTEDADGIFHFDFAGLIGRSAKMTYMDVGGYTTMKRDKFIRQRNKLLCNKRYVQNPRYYIPDGAYDHLNIVEMWPGGPEPAAEDKLSVVATDMIIPKKVNVYQPLELR